MAEFDDQHSRIPENVFLGVLWALTVISFFSVLFRVYVQLASFHRLLIDDFLVISAWIIILSAAIIWQVKGKILYELYAISAGEKPFSLDFLPRYNVFMRYNAPFQILFYTGLWCIKFSFMAFFYRLCSKVKAFRIWWFVVFFCTASVYIACIGDIEYKCSLGGIEYIITQCPQLHHIHYENRSFWANAAGDIVTDLMILSIPFLVLWNTKISRRKKLILLSMFSATLVIMVSAVIRVAVGMEYDRQINIDWLCFWSFIEVDIAIIVSCVPSLRQLFITTQNQNSSAKGSYLNTYEPMLKKSKEASAQDKSASVGDVESPVDEVPMSPLRIVHVRNDYEVTRDAPNASREHSRPDKTHMTFD
ncbi:hypothetical protein N7452_009789 [Penicillium brevicompactum]|uniref:Rhodopsin domain-containing protein n=1 Tax=Penicillium brevicompactum TaxID=5074 RepID=A0A9W9Q943_PENBR|nr:hypothetical protein N7452_009789 [Penicillium brevicompactum]